MRRTRWLVYFIFITAFFCITLFYVLPRLGFNFSTFLNRGSIENVRTVPGFEIEVFADGLSGPRFIAFGPDGVLYAAERGADRIVALPDKDRDGRADEILTFAGGLEGVHSLAYWDGSWYAGLPEGIFRLTDTDGDLLVEDVSGIYENYSPGQHNTRTVAFLPDGRMVVSLGSTCNVCEESDPLRAAVAIFDDPSGGLPRVFASGLRNAVGLTVHPETGELWATNNARDLLGEDIPPDSVHILQDGGFYGWPYCHAGRFVDPDMGFPGACNEVISPIIEIQAHSAPLGLVFYMGENFPPGFQGDLFIAYHGSWNRTIPTGYKVVRVPMDGGKPTGIIEDFVWGWLEGERAVSGRPVGLAVGPDGGLYISDDFGGRIYRILYAP